MSSGSVTLERSGDVATVTLTNPGKRNALDVAMWRELTRLFVALQALPAADAPVAVVVRGADGAFASGGDIAEFAGFRFDPTQLHDFHEHIVAPALRAVLACDLPLFAQIDGACIGGGLELAACCDIRICSAGSRFGAPIAKLGFPMAPFEMQLLLGVVPAPVLREMLLEARLLDAAAAHACGLVHAVAAASGDVAGGVAQAVRERVDRLAALSPQAARINKRTLRQIAAGGPSEAERRAHFDYAPSAEHREGIAAFTLRRSPRFRP